MLYFKAKGRAGLRGSNIWIESGRVASNLCYIRELVILELYITSWQVYSMAFPICYTKNRLLLTNKYYK